jgi:hypothetical protein
MVGCVAGEKNKIVVTAKMVEAGVREYLDWCPGDFSYQFTEPELVRRVFIAMTRAAPDDRGQVQA